MALMLDGGKEATHQRPLGAVACCFSRSADARSLDDVIVRRYSPVSGIWQPVWAEAVLHPTPTPLCLDHTIQVAVRILCVFHQHRKGGREG